MRSDWSLRGIRECLHRSRPFMIIFTISKEETNIKAGLCYGNDV